MTLFAIIIGLVTELVDDNDEDEDGNEDGNDDSGDGDDVDDVERVRKLSDHSVPMHIAGTMTTIAQIGDVEDGLAKTMDASHTGAGDTTVLSV